MAVAKLNDRAKALTSFSNLSGLVHADFISVMANVRRNGPVSKMEEIQSHDFRWKNDRNDPIAGPNAAEKNT